MRGIKAASANDIWIVGGMGASDSAEAHMLVLHWDGKSWQQLPMPALQMPASETLSGSYAGGLAISGGQMWIIGFADVGDGKYLSIILGQHICP